MSDPFERHGVLLHAVRRLRTAIALRDRQVADVLGLRDGDLNVLELLHREGPQSPTVLAQRTATHAATMTGVLVRLERAGWIGRRPVAGDRRSVRIIGRGSQRFTDLYEVDTELLEGVFRAWDPDRAQSFLQSLEEITQALESGYAPGGKPALE